MTETRERPDGKRGEINIFLIYRHVQYARRRGDYAFMDLTIDINIFVPRPTADDATTVHTVNYNVIHDVRILYIFTREHDLKHHIFDVLVPRSIF